MDLSFTARRNAYDHRLRDLTILERNPRLFANLGVPRSTAASWLRRGPRAVVSAEVLSRDLQNLQARVIQLEHRNRVLLAVVRLLIGLVRLSGARLDGARLPDGDAKAKVLDAIARARGVLSLDVALRVLGLSPARYHAWRRAPRDCLDDRSSCPKLSPTQLTAAEVASMHQMVVDEAYRHISLSGLALLAQRLKKVFASPATWSRLVRERGWLRPRRRAYPPKPTEGLRAAKPNEFWHLDVTIIRLLDGTRVYIHAVIDNFSRRILAWRAALRLQPQATCDVLLEAAKNLPPDTAPATVVTDSGVENVNAKVDAFLSLHPLRRILALVEIAFSNSMIEAWWRSLKHNWLYLNQLDSLAAIERLVAFYVQQHNFVLPHSAFRGHTPDEIYSGTAGNLLDKLAAQRRTAREARIAANMALKCEDCRPSPAHSTAPPSTLDSSAIPSSCSCTRPALEGLERQLGGFATGSCWRRFSPFLSASPPPSA